MSFGELLSKEISFKKVDFKKLFKITAITSPVWAFLLLAVFTGGDKESYETLPMTACNRSIKENVRHPATIEYSAFNSIIKDHGSYTTVYKQFTAKNSFGVKDEFLASCKVYPSGRSSVSIVKK